MTSIFPFYTAWLHIFFKNTFKILFPHKTVRVLFCPWYFERRNDTQKNKAETSDIADTKTFWLQICSNLGKEKG